MCKGLPKFVPRLTERLIRITIIVGLCYASLCCCGGNSYDEENIEYYKEYKDNETENFDPNTATQFGGVPIDTVFRETLEMLLSDHIEMDLSDLIGPEIKIESEEYYFHPSKHLFETEKAMLSAELTNFDGHGDHNVIVLTGIGDPDHDNQLEISYYWRSSIYHGASGRSTNGVVEYSREGIRYENKTMMKRVDETIEKVWRSRFPFSSFIIPYPLEIRNDTIQVAVNVKYPDDFCNACFLYTGIVKYGFTDSGQLVLLYEEIKRSANK